MRAAHGDAPPKRRHETAAEPPSAEAEAIRHGGGAGVGGVTTRKLVILQPCKFE